MNKLLGLFTVALAAACATAPAQWVGHSVSSILHHKSAPAPQGPDTETGFVKVAFGHVRQADGTMKNIAGMMLPYTAVRIKATPLRPVGEQVKKANPGAHGSPFATTTVYLADAGSGYAVLDPSFPDPDTLDDMQILPSGVNKPWKTLSFGMQTPDTHDFLIRWIIYDTFTSGLGAGVSAFSGVDGGNNDFGVIWVSTMSGQLKVTIDVSAAAPIARQTDIFVAQQFRSDSDLNGNGDFDQTISSVFNNAADVNIGTSDNTFYYDSDFNGIFDEEEVEELSSGFSNLLFGIAVNSSGAVDDLTPTDFNLDIGVFISGKLSDMNTSNDKYFICKDDIFVDRGTPGIRLELDTEAVTSNAISLHFALECGEAEGGSQLQVFFFNTTTQAWDLRSTNTMTSTDTVYDSAATNNPSKYIDPINQNVRVRVEVRPNIFGSRAFNFRIDKASWEITR
jgi:hypothetical protein